MSTRTTTWAGTLTATSSVAHAGETRGTITMLRRERILVDGELIHVPVVSGNSWRGQLRRTAEELLRDTLTYEGEVPLAAAHLLRSGGALTRSAKEPLSGARLARARELIPPLAIFGAAAGGRTYAGALLVGKLIPHLKETQHLTGHPGPAMLEATQLEEFTRVDEASTVAMADLSDAGAHTPSSSQDDGGGAMLYRVETFPAGTVFSTWLTLQRVTPLQHAFFVDVLDRFTQSGRIGGRRNTGHGTFTSTLTPSSTAPRAKEVAWRKELQGRRDEVLEALHDLA